MTIPPLTTPLSTQYTPLSVPPVSRQTDTPDKSVSHVGTSENWGSETNESTKGAKRTGRIECQTCKQRKYQDGSDDPGVSFKSPTHINPDNSAVAVMSHEQEHVRNESVKALEGNRTIVSQSVTLRTSVCPECGRTYVSGGVTRTVTKPTETSPAYKYYVNQKNMENSAARLFSSLA